MLHSNVENNATGLVINLVKKSSKFLPPASLCDVYILLVFSAAEGSTLWIIIVFSPVGLILILALISALLILLWKTHGVQLANKANDLISLIIAVMKLTLQ